MSTSSPSASCSIVALSISTLAVRLRQQADTHRRRQETHGGPLPDEPRVRADGHGHRGGRERGAALGEIFDERGLGPPPGWRGRISPGAGDHLRVPARSQGEGCRRVGARTWTDGGPRHGDARRARRRSISPCGPCAAVVGVLGLFPEGGVGRSLSPSGWTCSTRSRVRRPRDRAGALGGGGARRRSCGRRRSGCGTCS